MGERAGIKVMTDARTGKVKHASAHDLRRSFGERWASRVMPQTLMVLMRHESIETTLRYYVGRNAETTAETLYQAMGNTSGNKMSARPVRSADGACMHLFQAGHAIPGAVRHAGNRPFMNI